MIACCRFVAALDAHGVRSGIGVPCSTFTGPIAHLSRTGHYYAAANEGTAVAGAAGAALAGERQAVFAQNSGLGNMINPITSLLQPYELGVLGFVSLRGWPDPTGDEPQHAIMGAATRRILEEIGVWHEILGPTDEHLGDILGRASEQVAHGVPAFVLVPRGTFGTHPEVSAGRVDSELPDTGAIAATVSRAVGDDALIVSTTGQASRYLFATDERPRNFYMQGSMGHASAIGLGYASARPGRPVVVLDGDGAALMHLGVLSTVGALAPARFLHVVIDNGGYATTGGQTATSRTTNLAAAALACGYRGAVSVASLEELTTAIGRAMQVPGPTMIVARARGADGAAPPPRASSALTLPSLARRTRAHAAQ